MKMMMVVLEGVEMRRNRLETDDLDRMTSQESTFPELHFEIIDQLFLFVLFRDRAMKKRKNDDKPMADPLVVVPSGKITSEGIPGLSFGCCSGFRALSTGEKEERKKGENRRSKKCWREMICWERD